MYYKVWWKQNSAAPKTPQEIPKRALFKQEKGPLRPSTYNTFSLGTITSSKCIIPVSDAYKDILPSIEGASIPFIFSLSRTNWCDLT